jgi:hypothetical protein
MSTKKARFDARLGSSVAKGNRQVGFAHTAGAQQEDVFGPLNKSQ